MAYSNVPIGTKNPGCIVILVDQSSSMGDLFEHGTKAARAALAVNRVLNELVLACSAGPEIKDRCHISVIGYHSESFNGGSVIETVVDGMISEVAALPEMRRIKDFRIVKSGKLIEYEIEVPIWLDAKASGLTPMHSAFDRAAEVVEEWCTQWPNNFPPVVINITDGAPNFSEATREAAERLTALQTTDGNVLLFNLHISNSKNEIILPHNTDQVADDSTAEFLFHISSLLPESFFRSAQEDYDFWPEPGARCLAYHATETLMVKLLDFGSLGVIAPPSS